MYTAAELAASTWALRQLLQLLQLLRRYTRHLGRTSCASSAAAPPTPTPTPTPTPNSGAAQFDELVWGYFRAQRFAGDFADYGTEIQISDFAKGSVRAQGSNPRLAGPGQVCHSHVRALPWTDRARGT